MLNVINSRALSGEKPCINKGNSRAVNARLRNFQYDPTGATDLLPLRDVYYPALERPKSVEITLARHLGKGETKECEKKRKM